MAIIQQEKTEHPQRIDVHGFVDNAEFSQYQRFLLGLCFFATFIDGFDTQAVAVAGPMLRLEMALQPAQLGAIFATTMLGGIVAAFAMAPYADRIGRRPLLIISLLISAALSAGHALAGTFSQLLALRLGAGMALGVAVTVTYAYAAEVAPKRASATAVMVVSAGFGLGVAATGFIAAWLIPESGWRSVFYVGGAATLMLCVLLMAVLPESVRFMAQRSGQDSEIRRILKRIDPHASFPNLATFISSEDTKTKIGLANVLASGRAHIAIPLWISTFLVAFVIYVLMQWLPIFVDSAGATAFRTSASVGWFKLGGVFGGFICAACIERTHNPYTVLLTFLVLACTGFAGMVAAPVGGDMFMLSVIISGVFLNGPLYASNGLIGRLFPTHARTGGLAITAGVGRVGALTGPFIIGLLLQSGWSARQVFRAVPIPVLLALGLVAGLGLRERAAVQRGSST
ncbi:MFS transporter [Paraburkholderia sp. GAS32]|uniref:MFS transporter n=1 Tax=Paraburkholderia sp. GAS32 TaxID=3035129 RepID=UPI003D236BF1